MRGSLRQAALAAFGFVFGATAAAADEATRESCVIQLTLLQHNGLVGDFAVDPTVFVVVNENAWASAAYTDKVKLAEVFNCSVAGPGHYVDFEVRGDRTNNVIGLWRRAKLTIPE
jgi:hypothetical protein